MECNVVRDLIPLYIDACCSEESAAIVKEHMENCPACRALYESMNSPSNLACVDCVPKKLSKINDWKASVLQSVLLFVSFAVLTVGVAMEAATPLGQMNGYWALSLVIPSTGFLLSLANWYFVRLYKSRKSFSNWSFLVTLGLTMVAYIWAGFHYEYTLAELLRGIRFHEFWGARLGYCGVGMILTITFCVLSKLLSNKFATMLGKE